MQKKVLLAVTLIGACLAGWISSRGLGQAEAAGQQEVQLPQTGPRTQDLGKDVPQSGTKPLPIIPQEYFPPVIQPANGGQPRSVDLPTPSRITQTSAFQGTSAPPQSVGNAPLVPPGDSELKPAPFSLIPGYPTSNKNAPNDLGVPTKGSTPETVVADDAQGQSNDNPTGRQEPSVSLEWIGPPTAKLGQPVTYQIIVKNTSAIPVQNVTVRNRIPGGVTVQATEPRAINELNTLIWELGTLQPRQEKRLDLQLLPEMRGDLACQAFVSFTGMSQARIRVREPKLQLKISGPDKVLLGDSAPFSLTVTNPGDGSADQVKIRAALSEGLEHTRGRTVEFELGNLGPNESRSVQLVCTTKTGGPQTCEATAVAEGGLKAQDTATTEVLLPRLELNIAGPRSAISIARPPTW